MNCLALLQIGTSISSLLYWFVASVALVIAVTLVYVFILGKSPPPETTTQTKVEQNQRLEETSSVLTSANAALNSADYKRTIELSAKVVAISLSGLLVKTGLNLANMNISDMAYLVQTKAPQSQDITQHVYNLNLLHLRAAQGQQITSHEAEWAVSTASWLVRITQTGQVTL